MLRTAATTFHDGNKVTLRGGKGNDSIRSTGDNSKINGGTGNDTVTNHGKNVKITLDAGNDSIDNWGDSVTISGDSGKDTVDNRGSNVSIDGGLSKDKIINSGNNVSINGGGDKDTISNTAANVSIDGGSGNDSIINSGSKVSVSGGTGNDSITNSGDDVLFRYIGGDDIFTGFKSNSTLKIVTGTVNKAVLSGTDIFLTLDKGSVTLKDVASNDALNVVDANNDKIKLTLVGTAGNDIVNNKITAVNIDALGGKGSDYVLNSGSNVTISGGNSIDTLDNSGANVSIDGGLSKDKIINSGNSVTIAGGFGNDSVFNDANNVSISGGDGNDSVRANGIDVTISGGTGNDYVLRDSLGINVAYVYTSGNDTLENFGYVNALVLGDVKVNSSVRSNDGTIDLKLSNNNTLTLANYHSTKINAVSSVSEILKTSYTYNDESETVINGNSNNNYILNDGDSVTISAGKGDYYVLNAGTNDVSNYAENNLIEYKSGDGKDVIYGFEDDDLLKITGTFSTSYSSSKDEVYFKVGSTSKAITLKNFTASSFNVNGDTYKISGTKLVRS